MLELEIFNKVGFNDISQAVASKREKHGSAGQSFAAAWNAVPIRFQAMFEADDTFTGSVMRSNMPPADERYTQEKALFKFFTSARSSLECFYFASYCIGSIVDSDTFPIEIQKDLKIYPKDVSKNFNKRFSQDSLSIVLDKTIKAAEFEIIKEYRDFLSHRGALPRHAYVGGNKHGSAFIPENPRDLSDNWKPTFELNDYSTRGIRKWLEATLSNCIAELHSFTRQHF